MKTFLQSIAVIALFFSTQTFANEQHYICATKDNEKINRLLEEFLNNPKKSAITSDNADINPKYCLNNYALVRIHPKKPVADDLYVYLKKVNNNWQILAWEPLLESDKEYSLVPSELKNLFKKISNRSQPNL